LKPGWLVNHNTPHPLFFVSVAFKGFSPAVSLLSATLTRGFISVAAKGLTVVDCWRESNRVGWEDSEEARRTTWPIEALGKTGEHGSRGTPLSDRAGICDPDKIGASDRQSCGGQAEGSCRLKEPIIAYWYRMSMITCKWFGCCGIALSDRVGTFPSELKMGGRGSLRSSRQAG